MTTFMKKHNYAILMMYLGFYVEVIICVFIDLYFFLRYFILSIHVHVIAQQKLFYSHLGLDHIIFLCSSTYIFSHLHVYTISLLSVDHFKSN